MMGALLLVAALVVHAGQPVVDVIAELQHRGLTIVYSTKLVKPTMRVQSEPHATTDRALLDEILTPHNLAVKETSSGVLSIVRADRKPNVSVVKAAAPAESPAEVTLGSIVVTASNYSVLSGGPERRDFLSRQEVNRTAHLGDDLFRALGQLPGATPADFSAAFGIRGGAPDETLVVVDGLEIADPFHIKYFQNAISIIDSDAIGSIDYLSGGFPVEYGGALSGVIDMSTASPQQQRHTSAGISFTHARLVSDGTFNDDRGRWLVSLRRGYFDVLLGIFYSSVTARPHYGDVIAKVDERIGDRSIVSANVIAASDSIQYHDGGDAVDAAYKNSYGWLNLRTAWSPQLFSQSVASWSHLRQHRNGDLETNSELGHAEDRRSFDIAGLKQDWTLERPEIRQFFKAGFDWKHFRARYDYSMDATTIEPLLLFTGNAAHRTRNLSISPAGNSLAFYAADRIRVAKSLAVEAGARVEHESWGDGTAITPRINVVWTPTETTGVRAAWGEFRQAQRLDRLSVEDGDTAVYPAQRSRQFDVGIEHHFRSGLLLRGSVYRRNTSHVTPRYENIFDRDQLLPEATYDRLRIAPDSSRASGVEVVLKDESGRPFSWWVSVAHSKAVDRFGAIEAPRSWDQPDAVSFDLNYHRGSRWNFNFAGSFHSGWPTTPVTGVFDENAKPYPIRFEMGARNSAHLATYRRFDGRIMRSVAFSRGLFRSWFEITNVFNHPNECCVSQYSFSIDPSRKAASVQTNRSSGLGWLPSFGIAWEF